MAKFAIAQEANQQAIGAGFKTQAAVFAGATAHRGKVYEFMVGINGSPPADNELEIDTIRMTVDGTGTAFTPNPLDLADPASLASGKVGYTVEPTTTANTFLVYFAMNQRATVRWLAAPGSELIYPSTAASGICLRGKSAAYTSTMSANILFDEQ